MRAPIAVVVMAGFAAAATAILPGSFTCLVHERTLDTLLTLVAPWHVKPRSETSVVVVVDIDRRSLAAIGTTAAGERLTAAVIVPRKILWDFLTQKLSRASR